LITGFFITFAAIPDV